MDEAGQRQNEPPQNVAGIPVNYDEALVGGYTLPDPLILSDGRRVRDARTWQQKRRPEIVRLFKEHQFGRSPGRPEGMSFDVFDKGSPALGGRAIRRQVTVYFTRDRGGPKMDLLVYLPAGGRKPVPLLFNLSFTANSTRDTRFAMVIASCAGEGGAALSRRNFGETVKHLTAPTRYPYQFAANYQKLADRAGESPVDAHLLVALIAPRPLLLQTGDTDLWSDPKGEFLAAVAASPVYRLFGKRWLGTDEMPPAGRPVLSTLGYYYMHAGGHGTIPTDWEQFLKFMQLHLTTAR